jgi:bifunctional DNA-binding transcriptional regulator/antitoxin component of YhaV-PrlF toxin-antitoxin module
MYQSIVISEGQTTLPKPVREAFGVEAGDTLRYIISEGTV